MMVRMMVMVGMLVMIVVMSRLVLSSCSLGSAVLRHSADLLWIAPGTTLLLAGILTTMMRRLQFYG